MKILMISSEVTPFAKSGGLADAVQALSATLATLGHDVRVVMPRYYSVDKPAIKPLEGSLGVPGGYGEEWTSISTAAIPGTDVPVYFLDHERFFGRDGIYGTKAEPDFADNPERFSFLCRAVFQLCRKLEFIPDIMHAHDWPAALVPAYLNWNERDAGFGETKTVFTIHNLGYQGIYPKTHFQGLGLPWEAWYGAGCEDFDNLNFLKSALASADYLTTVSPTYAREIQTTDSGFRMDGLLRHRSASLVGILNGIDPVEWNPSKDTFVKARYDAKNLDGKKKCKEDLQKTMGLPENPDVPVIGIITRLVDQKGIGELFGPTYGCAYHICADMAVQMAVLGSGEPWCEAELKSLESKLPNFKVKIGYDNALAHKIEAGADFFLMPSRYEPCGLNQIYSLAYGTLPVAHRTGGLADTIENYDQERGTGTGFLYDIQSPRAIYDTVGWAVWAYYNRKEHIGQMRKRGMAMDFSWNASAREYVRLYEKALGKESVQE